MTYRWIPACLLCIIVLAGPAAALVPGYLVEPAYGTGGILSEDLARIAFFDLSAREMAIVLALSFAPVLVFPVELLFLLKIFAYLGFRRIARDNVLGNSTRSAIYHCITESPGIRIRELSDATRVSRGALSYHLALLRFQNKIVIRKTNGTTAYFANRGEYDNLEQVVLSYFRNDAERRILTILVETPARTRADLEHSLYLTGPTVTWHTKRLVADGLIAVARQGRFSRFSLTEPARPLVAKYAAFQVSPVLFRATRYPKKVVPAENCPPA